MHIQAFLPIQEEQLNWQEEISILEAQSLLSILQSGSFWKRRKAKKRLQKVLKSELISPIAALENWMKYVRLKQEISVISIELCDLGAENPEIELQIIDLTLQQTQLIS